MKIQCTKLIDAYTGQEKKSDDWLTVGKVYSVVSLYFNIGESNEDIPPMRIKVNGDMENKTSEISDPDCFEIIDNSFSENFGFFVDKVLLKIIIEPKAWLEYISPIDEYRGFWEDLFESEHKAVVLYRKELALINREPYIPLTKTKPEAKELLEIYRRKERDQCLKDGKVFDERKYPEPMAITCTDEW